MDRNKSISKFVIPKKARLSEKPATPVIAEGYRITKATKDEFDKICSQVAKRTAAVNLEDLWKINTIKNVEMIKNAKLEHNFNEFKKRVNVKEEFAGYRVVYDHEIDIIARLGMSVHADFFDEIGDTARGVLMYSSPASANGGSIVFKNKPIKMMMFRTLRGRSHEVQMFSGALEPSTKYNCHVPYVIRTKNHHAEVPPLIMEHKQGAVYHYEFSDKYDGVMKYPSQILPHAIITFERSSKPRGGFRQIYHGPIDFQLFGSLNHIIVVRQKTLRGLVHRLYNLQIYPEALYLKKQEAKIYQVKRDFEKFYELKFIRNLSPEKLFSMETILINGPGRSSSVAVYNVMTVHNECLELLKFLRKGGYFLVSFHHPWTVFYIPSGPIAKELGLPFTSNQMHLLVCRQSLNIATRDNIFIGTNQSNALHSSLVYDYAKNVRPDQREMKDDGFCEPTPEPEPLTLPPTLQVTIPICKTIHPSLAKPAGPSILKPFGKKSRGLKVSYREKITDVREFSSEKEVFAIEKPAVEKALSFDEQRKEEQRSKETNNLFKQAMAENKESRKVESTSVVSSVVKPIGTGPSLAQNPEKTFIKSNNIATSNGYREHNESKKLLVNQFKHPPQGLAPPLPPIPSLGPPTNTRFSFPPPLLPPPIPVPPPMYPAPPTSKGFFQPSGPFDLRIPPPGLLPAPGLINEDFSRPPPPPPLPPLTSLPTASAKTPSTATEIKKGGSADISEEKGEDDMEVDMDISTEESNEDAGFQEEAIKSDDKIKVEPMEVEEEKEEENEILKMVFEQTPRVQKPASASSSLEQFNEVVNSLKNKDVFMDILLQAKKAQKNLQAPTETSSSSAKDVDLRTSSQVNFTMNKKSFTPLLLNPNAGFSPISSTESSQDSDYRIRPSSSQKTDTKDRDDREAGSEKNNEKILNNIPMPKHSSKEEESRKRLEQIIQEKMRANSKNVDQTVINNQMGMIRENGQPLPLFSTMTGEMSVGPLHNLLKFRVTEEGLTEAKASEKLAQTSEDPVQIRSPSPEVREAYVPKSFLNCKEARVIPTQAKEGYQTYYGAQESSSSRVEEKKAEKPGLKKPRDYDAMPAKKSKMEDGWESALAGKSRDSGRKSAELDNDQLEKNTPGSSGCSNPAGKFEGVKRYSGFKMQTTLGARGGGSPRGQGRGRVHLLPTPQPYNGPFMPSPNEFQRGGRGARFQTGQSFQSRPSTGNHFLNQLEPVHDPSADNYCIFIDPELSVNSTSPKDIDELFSDFVKLNRSTFSTKVYVIVHNSIMNHMKDNKTELRQFYHAFTHYNIQQNRLVEVLPAHGCDGFCAPKATDMADCMNNVTNRKRGKEAILLSNSCRSDSENGRAFASRRVKVMSIRQLRRYLEDQGDFYFDEFF